MIRITGICKKCAGRTEYNFLKGIYICKKCDLPKKKNEKFDEDIKVVNTPLGKRTNLDKYSNDRVFGRRLY